MCGRYGCCEEKQGLQELDFSGPARGSDALANLEFAIERAMNDAGEQTVLKFLRAFCSSY